MQNRIKILALDILVKSLLVIFWLKLSPSLRLYELNSIKDVVIISLIFNMIYSLILSDLLANIVWHPIKNPITKEIIFYGLVVISISLFGFTYFFYSSLEHALHVVTSILGTALLHLIMYIESKVDSLLVESSLGSNKNFFRITDLKSIPFREYIQHAAKINFISPKKFLIFFVGILSMVFIWLQGIKWLNNIIYVIFKI